MRDTRKFKSPELNFGAPSIPSNVLPVVGFLQLLHGFHNKAFRIFYLPHYQLEIRSASIRGGRLMAVHVVLACQSDGVGQHVQRCSQPPAYCSHLKLVARELILVVGHGAYPK